MCTKTTTQAYHNDRPVGVIVCKQELHRGKLERGYIAMLSTEPDYRKFGIGGLLDGLAPIYISLRLTGSNLAVLPATTLVERAIAKMRQEGAQEVSPGSSAVQQQQQHY